MPLLLCLLRALFSVIAVDRFGAVVFPLRSPLISSKLCPLFILATWIVAIAINSPEFFVHKLVEYPRKLVCELHWNEVFGESLSFETDYLLFVIVIFILIPLVLVAILYIIIYLKGALSPYFKLFFDSFYFERNLTKIVSQGIINRKLKYNTENKQGRLRLRKIEMDYE